MIRARGVTKDYGSERVLAGVDFDIRPGEDVALLGVNGAGKTTLFRCLMGLVGFDGELSVDGLASEPGARDVRSRLAYVPQTPPIFDTTLVGFIRLFASIRGLDAETVGARLAALGLDLDEHGGKAMRLLSGGMIQKAYLGVALASESAVLLLDEPTASLDPRSRREFVSHLREARADRCVVLATHRIEEIEALTDRLLVLDAGRIAFDGSLRELLDEACVPGRLWIDVPEAGRTAIAADLGALPLVLEAEPNGSGVYVTMRSSEPWTVLHHLEDRGFTPTHFRVDRPALDEVLDRYLARSKEEA